jgi:4-hydroxybenzoate polyprenyltransferase
MTGTLSKIVRTMRPHQWIKNLVIFAALIFAELLRQTDLLLRTGVGFVAFCLLAASVYIFNDLKDRKTDVRHPTKRLRPIASGSLTPQAAGLALAVLLTLGLAIAWLVGRNFFTVAAIYLLLNLLYGLSFRNIVILDLITIAVGFVLRAIAGAELLRDAGHPVAISPWLLMCTFLLSLFLGLGKRYHELHFSDGEHRGTLHGYTEAFVGRLLTMTAAATLLSYGLYTIWPDTVARFKTTHLLYTVPFVFYGLSRYLYLVTEEAEGGDPSETLVSRRSVVVTVVLWFAAVIWILYRR